MKYKDDGTIIAEGVSPQALHDLKTKGLLKKINEEILKPNGLVAVVMYPTENFENESPQSIHIERWVKAE